MIIVIPALTNQLITGNYQCRLGHSVIKHDIDCCRKIHTPAGGHIDDIIGAIDKGLANRAVFRTKNIKGLVRVLVLREWYCPLDQFNTHNPGMLGYDLE